MGNYFEVTTNSIFAKKKLTKWIAYHLFVYFVNTIHLLEEVITWS